ncbi:hypothetical protein ARMSODRAFT_974824 [Armillaria solidipes]|uniref:Uncharacterized protein n=1 Tax=Armillaria solidipes TaxID=1076256 RepID=A0A2H3C326_9AGAR|nr:hypothetical protein ARMSODRAFT_974824 [Armillaria solidipes]
MTFPYIKQTKFLEARTSLKWQLSLLIAEEVEAVPESDLSGASEQEWVFSKRRRAVRRGGLSGFSKLCRKDSAMLPEYVKLNPFDPLPSFSNGDPSSRRRREVESAGQDRVPVIVRRSLDESASGNVTTFRRDGRTLQMPKIAIITLNLKMKQGSRTQRRQEQFLSSKITARRCAHHLWFRPSFVIRLPRTPELARSRVPEL